MMSQARSTWSPLKYRLFRILWISSTASHIGSYMTDVGQGWLMSSLTPSPLIVSLLLTAESLPFFVFGLPAGAIADIVDRRRLLIVSQFVPECRAWGIEEAEFSWVLESNNLSFGTLKRGGATITKTYRMFDYPAPQQQT